METWQVILTVAGAVLGSGGLWTFLTFYVQKRMEKYDNKTQMLLGLGHNLIMQLCLDYLERYDRTKEGISKEEYNNLFKYLFTPYKKLGGDGTAERLIEEVHKLPIRTGRLKDLNINNFDGDVY